MLVVLAPGVAIGGILPLGHAEHVDDEGIEIAGADGDALGRKLLVQIVVGLALGEGGGGAGGRSEGGETTKEEIGARLVGAAHLEGGTAVENALLMREGREFVVASLVAGSDAKEGLDDHAEGARAVGA